MPGVLRIAFRAGPTHVMLLGAVRTTPTGRERSPRLGQIDPVPQSDRKICGIWCCLHLHGPNSAAAQTVDIFNWKSSAVASSRLKS